MKIIEPAVVECKECLELIEINVDMKSVNYDNRDMGPEIEYEGIIESKCAKCANIIYVKISAWEYPEGALNYSEIELDGVNLIKSPVFSCIKE